jgi:nickel/cobalt exporter
MDAAAQILGDAPAAGWLYLPVALLLGALHGLEPGHAKTLMAAFVIAARASVPQAALLGLSAMVAHTAVVWALALAALQFGEAAVPDAAAPWLTLAAGAIAIALALRMLARTKHAGAHRHAHRHHHRHLTDADADADAAAADGGAALGTSQIVLFGLTGGLLPCSAAVAVLLVCLQVEAFFLGVALVGAFSLGLAATLIATGVLAAWGVRRVAVGGFGRTAALRRLRPALPYLSGALVLVIGLAMAGHGLALLAASGQ